MTPHRGSGNGVIGASPVLEIVGASKRFGEAEVLSDVSLALGAGDVVGLVGENGAGKSTLIKILSGALRPDAGEVRIDGRPVTFKSPVDARRRGVATVFQETNVFNALSVAENLLLGSYPGRAGLVNWSAMYEEADEFLASHGLKLDVRRRARDLSVANKQILAIARALHNEARVLILDEPTAVLGGTDVTRLLEMMDYLRGRGVGLLFVSHRLNEILEVCDHYVVLRDGRRVGTGKTADTTQDELVAKMVGRALSFERLRADHVNARQPSPKEVLRVENLVRPGVLRDVSVTLREGEIVGLAGLRGAGRTELARAIFGADRFTEGRIFVDGREIGVRSPLDAVRAGIGLVPEERGSEGLFRKLSTAKNVPIVRMAKDRRRRVSPRDERRRARGYVNTLAIRLHSINRAVGRLSGGNQQKVVLAKWLDAGVRVLLLDEPTRGVDVGAKEEIYHAVRRLVDDGVGVLLISSELSEILAMSDRILVMHEGAIVAEIDGATATEESVMTAAVGGRR